MAFLANLRPLRRVFAQNMSIYSFSRKNALKTRLEASWQHDFNPSLIYVVQLG